MAKQQEQQVFGYIRVSTTEQANEGVSLDAQEERIRVYCLLQGFASIRLYREEGVSGAVPLVDRPAGRQMLKELSKAKHAHVIALKLDRLFRDASDCLSQTKVWDKAGISLHLLDMGGQAINTASAMGRMFLTMAAGFAELERNLIAERTASALQYKKARREAYSPTPFGYDRQGDTLLPQQDEQETVAWIQAQREAGLTLRAIASALNEKGVATKQGGTWYASTVKAILDNSLHTPAIASLAA